MNLYKISQDENNDYDTWDSAVVVAKDEQEARLINLGNHLTYPDDGCDLMTKQDWDYRYSSWCSSPDKVVVEFLGVATESYTKRTVICASYNAG